MYTLHCGGQILKKAKFDCPVSTLSSYSSSLKRLAQPLYVTLSEFTNYWTSLSVIILPTVLQPLRHLLWGGLGQGLNSRLYRAYQSTAYIA